jgi:hypothetical protein
MIKKKTTKSKANKEARKHASVWKQLAYKLGRAYIPVFGGCG